ncbi:MAG: glycerophosphodiester phosphodiesterase family protein, partial [Oscillospiraceae bacterium]
MNRFLPKNKVIVAGHRGIKALYPENTFVSFQAAIDAGVDMIETDLRLTSDGNIVVIHDKTVDRTTD